MCVFYQYYHDYRLKSQLSLKESSSKSEQLSLQLLYRESMDSKSLSICSGTFWSAVFKDSKAPLLAPSSNSKFSAEGVSEASKSAMTLKTGWICQANISDWSSHQMHCKMRNRRSKISTFISVWIWIMICSETQSVPPVVVQVWL